MIAYLDLPKFQTVDEWETEIEKITVAYRIKSNSDSKGLTYYLATCWQRGVPSYSASKKFDERPNRIQVEIQLGDASAEIVERAIEGRNDNRLPNYRILTASQKNSFEFVFAPIENPIGLCSRYRLEVQIILKKSKWLMVKSDEIIKASAELSKRLASLNERSRRLCKF